MKATELRIGNWISLDGKPVMVAAIQKDPAVIEYDIHYWPENSPLTKVEKASRFEPLEFTQEMFNKLGVNYLERNQLATGWRITLTVKHTKFDLVISWELEHIHQLQNLYHALSGADLST